MAETPDVKQLLLTVDANAELLRTGLLKAARDVQAFQTTTDSALARVDQRFKQTGENTSRALQGITRSAGQVRNATQDLGYQISDLGTQISSGTDPMRAFSQQIGQVAFALSGMNGAVGQVGTFLAGPWGAALIFAAQVLGPFVAKLFEGATAADKQKGAATTLTEALGKLDQATGRLNDTAEKTIKHNLDVAQSFYQQELKARNATKALLDNAIAEQSVLNARARGAGTNDTVALGAAANQGYIGSLQALRAQQDVSIATAQVSLRGATYASVLSDVKAKTDATAAATRDYEREQQKLKDAFTEGKISQDQLSTGLTAATNKLQAAKDAIKEEGKSHRAAASDAKRHADELARLQAKTDAYLASLAAGVPGQKLNLSLPSPQELQRSLAQTNGEKAFDPLASVSAQLDESGKARFAQQQEAMKGIADEAERAQKAGQAFRSDLASGLADAIVNGKSLGDALVNAFKRAAVEALASGLFKALSGDSGSAGGASGSGGFLASLGTAFSSAFGKREFGGPVSANKPYIVGEKRPELFVPNTPGRIIPSVPSGGGGGGGGQRVDVHVTSEPSPFLINTVTVGAAAAGRNAASQALAGARRQSIPGSGR